MMLLLVVVFLYSCTVLDSCISCVYVFYNEAFAYTYQVLICLLNTCAQIL